MQPRLLRPLLVLVFLIALNSWLTLWNLVGGTYHLELMAWPWKLALSLLVAGLATRLTADLAAETPRSPWGLISALAIVMAIAGGITYYTHLNEPADEDSEGEPQVTKTAVKRPSLVRLSGAAGSGVRVPH